LRIRAARVLQRGKTGTLGDMHSALFRTRKELPAWYSVPSPCRNELLQDLVKFLRLIRFNVETKVNCIEIF
jgi:hypothetical protein